MSCHLDPQELNKVLQALESKITAARSRWPNTSGVYEIRGRIGTAQQALAQLFLCSFLEPWETDRLIRAMSQKCYQCSYQGAWQEVQEILEHYPKNSLDFTEKYLQHHSPEEFFGNLLRSTEREILIAKWVDPSQHSSRPVKKRVRRRGYRDHGTLRLPHERHGEPVSSPEREDRRDRVSHPLLQKTEESEVSVARDYGSTGASRKAGENDVSNSTGLPDPY